jgi:4-alpha-glucanotransferase
MADEIRQVSFAQFLQSGQGERLKQYARAKGLRVIGDMRFLFPDFERCVG